MGCIVLAPPSATGAVHAGFFARSASAVLHSSAEPGEKKSRTDRSVSRSLGDLHDKIVSALDADQADEAGKLLKLALKTIRRSKSRLANDDRAEWYLLETRVEFARKRHPRGMLAAMKVVILLPDHPRVPEALIWVARGYEDLGRPSKAVDLYEECLSKKNLDSITKMNARTSLDRLRTKVPQ